MRLINSLFCFNIIRNSQWIMLFERKRETEREREAEREGEREGERKREKERDEREHVNG